MLNPASLVIFILAARIQRLENKLIPFSRVFSHCDSEYMCVYFAESEFLSVSTISTINSFSFFETKADLNPQLKNALYHLTASVPLVEHMQDDFSIHHVVSFLILILKYKYMLRAKKELYGFS